MAVSSVAFDRFGMLVFKRHPYQRENTIPKTTEVYVGPPGTVKFFKQYDKQRIEAFKKAKKNKKRIPLPPAHF